jgi:uncharacterized membrane protein (UPF0127 family)
MRSGDPWTTVRPVRVETSDGIEVCGDCRVADSFAARLRGLLGRRGLEAGEGLLIPRTSSVHTHFMRFAIDVVFLDADGRVAKIARGLRPWRFTGARGAKDVLELPSGRCDRVGLREGALLVRTPAAYPAGRP